MKVTHSILLSRGLSVSAVRENGGVKSPLRIKLNVPSVTIITDRFQYVHFGCSTVGLIGGHV
jgi:hypothetical protein